MNVDAGTSRCLKPSHEPLRNLVRKFQNPDCHLKEDEKVWVERRIIWLRTFRLRANPPGPAGAWLFVLPKKWDRSSAAGEDLFNRLCEFMRIDAGRLELDSLKARDSKGGFSVCRKFASSGPAGLYIHPKEGKRIVISLDESGLVGAAALCRHDLP